MTKEESKKTPLSVYLATIEHMGLHPSVMEKIEDGVKSLYLNIKNLLEWQENINKELDEIKNFVSGYDTAKNLTTGELFQPTEDFFTQVDEEGYPVFTIEPRHENDEKFLSSSKGYYALTKRG